MEISKQVIEVLDYIGEKIGMTIDWSTENVMPYVQELASKYIRWEITTSIMWIVLAVITLTLGIYITKKGEKTSDDWILVVMISAVAIPVIITQVFDITKCITIPELQLYEYVTSLIK